MKMAILHTKQITFQTEDVAMKSGVSARTKSRLGTRDQVEYKEIMEILGTAGAVPALFGLWAGACLVGGLLASGGPVAMVKQLFTAVTGF